MDGSNQVLCPLPSECIEILCALLQDIYIARAEQELVLEEELYWALINIYRRPELLYELTQREKKDQ